MIDVQWHRVFTVARKAGVGLLGAVATGVAAGWFKSPWNEVAVAVLAVATYLGVYHTPNQSSDPGSK